MRQMGDAKGGGCASLRGWGGDRGLGCGPARRVGSATCTYCITRFVSTGYADMWNVKCLNLRDMVRRSPQSSACPVFKAQAHCP